MEENAAADVKCQCRLCEGKDEQDTKHNDSDVGLQDEVRNPQEQIFEKIKRPRLSRSLKLLVKEGKEGYKFVLLDTFR